MSIRVLVVDDQAMVREGFAALLGAQEDIEVVGQAENGVRAVELAALHRPDVVLMDVRMPVMDGLEAARRILAQAPGEPGAGDTHVLMLTTFDVDDYVYDALRLGASGFLLKDALADELVAAVRIVASGEALLALGYGVEWHDYPMEHSVCPEEVADLNRWLVKVLSTA